MSRVSPDTVYPIKQGNSLHGISGHTHYRQFRHQSAKLHVFGLQQETLGEHRAEGRIQTLQPGGGPPTYGATRPPCKGHELI